MNPVEHLESDLRYVRAAVETSDRQPSPASIYFLWAAITLVGFVLVDVADGATVGTYWTIAAPLGFVVSLVLGRRSALASGQTRRRSALRYLLHWGALMAAIFLIVPLGATGAVAWPALLKIILLITALGYFLAGIHLDRALAWVGLLMVVGYGALFVVPAMSWSLVGAILAVALVAAGLSGRSRVAAT